MLLEFKLKNFRSFYNEAVLSMLASKQREHDDFLIKTVSPERRILPSTVIYGPNASGKSSLILALDFLKQIVENGSIRIQKENYLTGMMELFPFIHDYQKYKEPIRFEITYLMEEMEFVYGIAIETNWGKNKSETTRTIVGEYLKVNQKDIFARDRERIILAKDKKAIKFYQGKPSEKLLDTLEQQINANLDSAALFLTGAFKSVVNSELANKAIRWFSEKLIPIRGFDEISFKMSLPDNFSKGKFSFRNAVMKAMLQHSDFGPQDIRFVVNNEEDSEQNMYLRSRYRTSHNPFVNEVDIPSEWLESKGTIKMLEFSLPFVQTLKRGCVLVVDELDSSLHPDLVAAIVGVFNNSRINTQGAQLIFNTHNPIYLNKNIFRRDQILFVEKNRDTYESELYSLADFKTYGENPVRDDERFMKNYLSGKYGAIPFIDFEAAVYQALNEDPAKGEM